MSFKKAQNDGLNYHLNGTDPSKNISKSKKHSNSSKSKRKLGKNLSIPVHFLDNTVTVFQVPLKSLGKWLFAQVCETLNLAEVDYFGLEYYDENQTGYWLDSQKPINKQLSLNLQNPVMYFGVKFYTPDPFTLEDEMTRYLLSLQIRKDLATGQLQCNENIAALISSYIVQSEIGNYDPEEYTNTNYINKFKLIPHQDSEFELKVVENHKRHVNLSPSQADLHLIEIAKRCELYAIKFTPVKDREGELYNLSVTHVGVIVFQNTTKINTFIWSKIRKLSFKRKRFLIKLHQEMEYYGEIVVYLFNSRNECKNFWKKCVEQHTFFRCTEVKNLPRTKKKIFTRGSSFRYSGRTQQQVTEYARHQPFKRTPIPRSNSIRGSGSKSDSNESTYFNPYSSISNLPLTSSRLLQRVNSLVDPHTFVATSSSSQKVPNETEYLEEFKNLIKCHYINIYFAIQVDLYCAQSDYSSFSAFRSINHYGTIYSSIKKNSETSDRSIRVFFELMMTEKTFKKDFEILHLWLREELKKFNVNTGLDALWSISEQLLNLHCQYLDKIESLSTSWKICNDLFDSFINLTEDIFKMIPHYRSLVEQMPSIIDRMNTNFQFDREFERICNDFESKKGCHLPYTSFLFKTTYHLHNYRSILKRLIECSLSNENPIEIQRFENSLRSIDTFISDYASSIDAVLNTVIIIELRRDIIGLDSLIQNKMNFIRQGCLLKLSKKGYQQRIFFLFSDLIVYCSRLSLPHNKFTIHGFLALNNVMVEETESQLGANYCFTIYASDRALALAAKCEKDRKMWIQDIFSAAHQFSNGHNCATNALMAGNVLDKINQIMIETDQECSKVNSHLHRSNTLSHVCWHRSCSISFTDFKIVYKNSLSGHLLRKFKSNSGWQKLWVVYTHFCLFFYKSSVDVFPLANLPLLGYSLSLPNEKENIKIDNVFKLSFKTHAYFFRAEDDYAFKRWTHAIGTATENNL